jgi:hypothetical protein
MGTATGQTATISTFLYVGVPTNGQPGNVPPNNSGVWTDTVNGGTFTPAASAPTKQIFDYHYRVRVVQMPNNSTIYQPGQVTYLNLISIHD